MSIRPIDMQTILSRTQDIERLQRQQNNHAKIQQEQFAIQLEHSYDEKSHQVTAPDSAQQSKIGDREHGQAQSDEHPGQGDGKKQNSDGKKREEVSVQTRPAPDGKGKIIDVKA